MRVPRVALRRDRPMRVQPPRRRPHSGEDARPGLPLGRGSQHAVDLDGGPGPGGSRRHSRFQLPCGPQLSLSAGGHRNAGLLRADYRQPDGSVPCRVSAPRHPGQRRHQARTARTLAERHHRVVKPLVPGRAGAAGLGSHVQGLRQTRGPLALHALGRALPHAIGCGHHPYGPAPRRGHMDVRDRHPHSQGRERHLLLLGGFPVP